MFPSLPKDGMHFFVFPKAVALTQGNKVSLSTWYLGAFYARLDKCLKNITRSVGRSNIVSYVNTNFLQLFLWEKFRAISPLPLEFKTIQLKKIDVVDKVKKSQQKSRGQMWYEVTWPMEAPRNTIPNDR